MILAQSIKEYSGEITHEEAQFIAEKTKSESTLENKTPEQLIENSKAGSIILKVWEQIIWCIFLMQLEYGSYTIYERGSLRIDPQYRWHKLWWKLMEQLTNTNIQKPILSITSVSSVQNTNNSLWMKNYSVSDISMTSLKEALEEGWPLHDKYKIYMNKTMQWLFDTIQ